MNFLWLRMIFSVAVVVFMLTLVSPVYANVDDMVDASFSALVDNARAAYEEGNYDRAVRLLLLANRKEPNALLLLNIARSYGLAEDCVQSYVYYRAFLGHPDAREDLKAVAQEQLDDTSDCPAFSDELAGRLMLESEPLLATVYLNDEVVGNTPLEVGGLTPGQHTVRFEREGFETDEQTFEIESGENLTVGGLLKRTAVAAEPPSSPRLRDADKVSGPSARAPMETNIAAYSLIGLGVGALTAGMIHSFVIIPDTSEAQLSASPDSVEYQRLSNRYDSQKTVALTAYVGGGLLAAGGGAWLLFDYLQSNASSTDDELQRRIGWRFVPSFNGANAGFSLFRSF